MEEREQIDSVTDSMDIFLVPPRIWEPLVADAFRFLKHTHQEFARQILTWFHDRHVGMTPDLTAELVPPLMDVHMGFEPGGVWELVFQRFITEWEMEIPSNRQIRNSGEYRFGLFAGADPMYTIFRIVLPLVDVACQQLGQCVLFAEQNPDSDLSLNDYQAYAQALSQTIRMLAEPKANTGQKLPTIFWKEQALALSGISRSHAIADKTGIPFTRPGSTACLFRLRPGKGGGGKEPGHVHRTFSILSQRKIHRRREGGVDGIFFTRGENDLDAILLSEFLNPPAVLAERMTHSGYLAIERSPRSQNLQDVLLMAILPTYFQSSLTGDFIKACWLNAVVRFSFVLQTMGLVQSRFRWIEGNRFQHAHVRDFFLNRMAIPTSITGGDWTPNYKWEFMSALKWLPDFMDVRNQLVPVPPDSGVGQTDIQKTQNWILSAWNRLDPASDKHHNKPFTLMHVMVFLPVNQTRHKRERLDGTHLLLSKRDILMKRAASRHVSVTWVPDCLDDLHLWAYAATEGGLKPVFHEKKGISSVQIAQQLEKIWYQQWLKEIHIPHGNR